MLASHASSPYEARPLENPNVLRHGMESHRERTRDCGDSRATIGEASQYGAPRLIGDCPVDVIELVLALPRHQSYYTVWYHDNHALMNEAAEGAHTRQAQARMRLQYAA